MPTSSPIPAWKRQVYGYAITGDGPKRHPSKRMKALIRERQGDVCLYCDLPIGSVVRRRGNDWFALRPNWDHFIPYAYSRANSGHNWVLACHVCNGIKGARMFETVAEAQAFIADVWIQKGYEIV